MWDRGEGRRGPARRRTGGPIGTAEKRRKKASDDGRTETDHTNKLNEGRREEGRKRGERREGQKWRSRRTDEEADVQERGEGERGKLSGESRCMAVV